MTPQELKNSILQRAIEGKLVDQRKEEGTGEELYKLIQEEKNKLIKEGKIKKQKPLPEIIEEEIPFDIPESWKWVRWGDVVNIVSSRRVHKSDWKYEGIPFFRAREIVKLADYGCVDNELFISKELFNELSKSGIPKPGDLMVTAVGTLGKTYIVRQGDSFYYKDASVICFENFAHINPNYLKNIMQSGMMMRQFRKNSSGTTVATLTISRTSEYLLPLPPLAEQKRIVEKIEDLMLLVDEYGKNWQMLEDLNKKFPEDLKKSLLQEAIKGRLVDQRKEEGTGEELFELIKEEKKQLIKDGKIKKQKPLPEITEEEIPFDIPETWKWVRLGDISDYNNVKTKVKPNEISSNTWVLDLEDIEKETGTIIKRNVASNKKIKGEKVIFNKGQILYSKLRPYLKKILVAPSFGVCSPELVPFSCFNGINHKFLVYLLKSPFLDRKINLTTYGVKMPRVGTKTMVNLLLPLPPLAEQKRIVEKLEDLLPLCDQLIKN